MTFQSKETNSLAVLVLLTILISLKPANVPVRVEESDVLCFFSWATGVGRRAREMSAVGT